MFLMLIFFFVALKGIYFSKFGLNFYNYGETLHNAVRVLEGQVLYKDIWSFFPPGFNYFPAIIFGIFGQDLMIIRFIESLIFAFLIGVIILIIRDFLSRSLIILLSIVLAFSDVNIYLFFYNIFFFAALFYLIKFSKTSYKMYLFYSGIMVGLGFFFRHDTAIMASMTIGIILVLCNYYKVIKTSLILLLSSFIFGVAASSSAVFLLIIRSVSLIDFLRLAFLEAPRISKTLSSGFDISKILAIEFSYNYALEVFTFLYYIIFFSVYIVTALKLYSEFRAIKTKSKFRKLVKNKIEILSLLIFGIFSIPHTISVIELGHLVKAGIPAVILGFFLLQEYINNKSIIRRTVALLLVAAFLGANLIMSIWWIKFNDTKVRFESGEVYLNSVYKPGSTHPSASTINKSIDFIKTNTTEGEYIFVAPYHAMLYFLSNRKSPTKYNNFAAGILTTKDEDELIKKLEVKNVRVVIYDPINAPHGKNFSEYSPSLDKYIMTHFNIIEITQENWLFMKRK